jgi:hypothetical protein
MGDWKGVRLSLNGQIELYNLRDDIGEENNLADGHPQIVKEIAHIMQTAHVDSSDFPISES